MMEKSKNWMKRYNIGHDAKSPVIGAFLYKKSTDVAVIKIHCYICAFMSTKALPNYKDKKNRYYICVFLITAISAIKKHTYICAFLNTALLLR